MDISQEILYQDSEKDAPESIFPKSEANMLIAHFEAMQFFNA